MNNNISWVAHTSLDQMYRRAQNEAAFGGSKVFPATIIREGERTMLSAAIPAGDIISLVKFDTRKHITSLEEARTTYNRPLDETHANEFGDYLIENIKRPFIPSVSLSAADTIKVHYVPKVDDVDVEISYAALVVPRASRLSIVDGQHRIYGIAMAYEAARRERNREAETLLDKLIIPALVTTESDIAQSHRDFYDASLTKPLPASLLAAYDTRNVARTLLADLVEHCQMFGDGRLDFVSGAIRRQGPALWLFNQVQMAVKTYFTGSYAIADDAFQAKMEKTLRTVGTPEYQEAKSSLVEFFCAAQKSIRLLKEASNLSPEDLREKVPVWRAEGNILLTATGLSILARIGYDMRTAEDAEWKTAVNKLSKVDWSVKNPMWRDAGVVLDGRRIATAHRSIETGARAVEIHIGWIRIGEGGVIRSDRTAERERELVVS